MQSSNPSLLPQQSPTWNKWRNPNSPSRSYSTLSSIHMKHKGSTSPMPVGRSKGLSSTLRTSPTCNAMTSENATLPVSRMSLPDAFSQSDGVEKRETTAGKSLLEMLGMRQLSLLERLGMPKKKEATPKTCDGAGMMMTTPLELSQNGRAITMMSTTHITPGIGVHAGENPLGVVGQASAPSEKPKC